MTEFRVTRDGSTVEDAVYDVDPVVDTANPFGDYAVIKLDDRGGNKFDQYERGTRVDVEIIDESGTTFDRFTGYVVERRENEQAGADALEVEVYSFDQFLRRNTVTNDQRGNTIAQALADIIQTDTPVSYVAGNVDVGDEQELTRSYQGEAVETVLRDFAFKSNNEEFGVNDALEFFFRPRETRHIDRGIDNTEWFRYDIPELGKEAINEVEVWFDDGEESVIVDDGTDKLDLQDNLGLPSPGTQRAELNRPLVTDIADAEDIGRKYLKFRNSTLSGTVTTFGLYNAEPGDTIDITIDSRGIDSEFVIAGVEYRWGVDETILTIIERRGDVDDILTDLNDSVQRVEMEGANRDAPSNRITTTNATGIVAIDASAEVVQDTDSGTVTNATTTEYSQDTTANYEASISLSLQSGEEGSITVEALNNGTVINSDTTTIIGASDTDTISGSNVTFDELRFTHSGDGTASWNYTVTEQEPPNAVRFVNDGRRAVRDTWTGDAAPDITTLVVGDDGTGLSRSNDTLRNQTASASVTQTLPNATSVEFTASVTQTGVQELGLETADGRLITRAVFDGTVDLSGDVTVTLTVSNDASVSRGVITTDGQTAVRDVLADNAPALPDAYAYGRDGTTVSESDTALGDKATEVSLEEVLIQDADTRDEWLSILPTISDTDAFVVDTTGPRPTQVCWTEEGEDFDTGSATGDPGALDTYSGANAARLDELGDNAIWTFTPEHDIPSENVEVAVRADTRTDSVGIEWRLNDNVIDSLPSGVGLLLGWDEVGDGTYSAGAGYTGADLEAGTEYSLEVECVDGTGDTYLADVIAPYDGRFSGDLFFDNDNGGSGGYLDGPELYPAQIDKSLATAETRRDVTTASFTSTWNDVSNNQYVELANDGSTFTRVSNSATGSVSFASPNRGVDTNIAWSRYGSRTTATPQQGFEIQQIDTWRLDTNPDAVVADDISETLARAVVPPGTLTGETLREAGLKHAATDTLLSRHELAEFTVESSQRISSAESSTFTGDE